VVHKLSLDGEVNAPYCSEKRTEFRLLQIFGKLLRR
jgi:hypothetical protein